MKNRFSKKEIKKRKGGILIPLVSFIIIFALFVAAISMLSNNTEQQQLSALNRAVTRDILHCFASEGRYPKDITYLEDNYALSYNHDHYSIKYENPGTGEFPTVEITVINH